MTDDRICHVEGCGRPMPTGDNSTACPRCWNILERNLGQVPALVAELDTTISRQAAITLRNGPRSGEKPLPFHLEASRVATDLHATLWAWVREGLEARPQVPLPDPSTVGLSRCLLVLFGWLVIHEDGACAVGEIGAAVERVEHVIDRAPDLMECGPCPTEDCPGHLRVACEPGPDDTLVPLAPTVRCRDCGEGFDVAERREALLADNGDLLLTIPELLAALARPNDPNPITRKRIEKWAERGRLVAHVHVPNPRGGKPLPMYRLDDVRDLDTLQRTRGA